MVVWRLVQISSPDLSCVGFQASCEGGTWNCGTLHARLTERTASTTFLENRFVLEPICLGNR